jgi:peptidoglycan-N-acetylglucosamine deacetylase
VKPKGIPRAGRIAAALVLIAIATGGYAAHRLWIKSDDLLQPVVIMQGDDARAMVKPSIGARIAALTGSTQPPPGARERLVALTFDDGPYPVTTPLLLQTLHDLHVPATFFLIGRDAEQFPSLAQAIVASGNEIADHTLTHPDLDKLGTEAVRGELLEGAATLDRIAPDPAERRLFRPPHGRYTLGTIRAAQAAGFDTILWSDDPGDWRSISGETIRAHVLSHATTPEIVLLHSGRVATVASLPDLVARFRKAGYTFVTVGELLRRSSAAELNHPAKSPLGAG